MANPEDAGKARLDDARARLLSFRLDVIKTTAVVIGVLLTAGTFVYQQFAADGSVMRELRKPYEEKRLSLYLEATRLMATLAANPADPDIEKKKQRFWELYWGELAFVESDQIEQGMVKFCRMEFDPSQCNSRDNAKLAQALTFSRAASKEIRDRWFEKPAPPITKNSALPVALAPVGVTPVK